MYLQGIVLSLALLCFITGGRSEPQCVFSIPSLLKSGEMARGCLEVKRHTEPVDVDITLEVSGVNYTIFNEQVPVGNNLNCPEFQVPSIISTLPVFVIIKAAAINYSYTERRAVLVHPTKKVTLMQLERSSYKPGQKVRFNVFALDNNLKPVEDKYPIIHVTDPSGNRQFQWINKETNNSILSLSFDLLDDPELGEYRIQVERESGESVSQNAIVEKYVLPKYTFEISGPDSITTMDKELTIQVNAQYSYGQPVSGKVSMRICRKSTNYYRGNACNRNPDGLCSIVTENLDSNGTFSGELDLAPFQLGLSGFTLSLNVEIIVIESDTGIQAKKTKVIGITNQMARAFFNRKNMELYFKRGIPMYVEVAVVDGHENPLSDQIIELKLNGVTLKNLTTDANGTAQDFIDTSDVDQPQISLQVSYENTEECYDPNFITPTYSNDFYTAERYYSPSASFVQIEGPKEELQCGQTYTLTAKYIFGQSGLQEGETTTDFIYIIMSRGRFMKFGKFSADLTNSLQGEFTIPVEVTEDLVPVIDIVVYCTLEKEVVTHTLRLNTEKCFRNKVSLHFSEERAKPGSTINLDITSSPNSLCAMRVYDSSLQFLRDEHPLTPERVYSSLQYNTLNGYNFEGYNVAPKDPPCVDGSKQYLIDGLYYSPVESPNERDTFDQLSSVGLHLITSIRLKKPTLCGGSNPVNNIFGRPGLAIESSFVSGFSNVNIQAAPNVQGGEIRSVRTRFPEVLLFSQAQTDESGSQSVAVEVPGTITKWNGEIACMDSNTGFGMNTSPTSFISFQEMFIDLALPYSLLRDETVIINAVVSNFMDKSAKIRVTVAPSADYTVESLDEETVKCVSFGGRASFSFSMKAQRTGTISVNVTAETVEIGYLCGDPTDPNEPMRIDTVSYSVIVEPPGIPKEETKTSLVCVQDSTTETPVSIPLPANSVEGSVKGKVTVIGDLLGRAIVNPQSLINEPTGSGEQNLATLMPIPVVLHYMNTTSRLTEEARSQGVEFMGIGYRRQLRFRNSDGGFSNFAGGISNSWLTLRTLETFQLIKPYTFVEDKILNQALVYLERLKDPNTGGFKPQGSPINNALMGGAEDETSFTALVAIVLFQGVYAAAPTLLRDAMSYLDEASRRNQNVYNKALLFNAFVVAGNEERSNAMFEQLREEQIEQGGTIHWERLNKPNNPTSSVFSPRAASTDIEITSHVLQAYSLRLRQSQSTEDLSYASKIARYLSEQQTSLGAYSSTSDTVNALKALSSYGAFVHQPDANNVVEVKYGNEVVKKFTLDSGNRNILQTHSLANIPGDYNMVISGNGCVLLQTTVNYNIPVIEEDSAFQVSVYVPPESCVDGVAYTMPVHINVSYNGPRNESNIALIDIAMPSGYSPEPESLTKLTSKVAKVEEKYDHLIIYVEKIFKESVLSLEISLEMGTRLQNFQSKYVRVSDAYEKEENGIAVFRHPCSTQ